MLSVADVESILENFDEDDYSDGWYYWKWESRKGGVQVAGLGNVTVAESVGGGEGSGEYVRLVLKVVADDSSVRYFSKEGYYASYDGTTWDGAFTEVRPREKMITVYE